MEDAPVPEADATAVQAFWDLVTGHLDRLSTEAAPGPLAPSRTAADERARAIAELSEAHAAALTALLGVLRSRDLDDTAARAHATELAVTSLVELRAAAERDQAVAEEPADQAFARLAESLRPLLSHGPVGWNSARPATAVRWPPTSCTRRVRSYGPWSSPYWNRIRSAASTSAGRSATGARTAPRAPNCARPCGTTGPATCPATPSRPPRG